MEKIDEIIPTIKPKPSKKPKKQSGVGEPQAIECNHMDHFTGVGQSVVPTPDEFIIFLTCVCTRCGVMTTTFKTLPRGTKEPEPEPEPIPDDKAEDGAISETSNPDEQSIPK